MTTDNLWNRKALSLSRHLTGLRSFFRDPSKTDKLSHWVDQATPLQLAGLLLLLHVLPLSWGVQHLTWSPLPLVSAHYTSSYQRPFFQPLSTYVKQSATLHWEFHQSPWYNSVGQQPCPNISFQSLLDFISSAQLTWPLCHFTRCHHLIPHRGRAAMWSRGSIDPHFFRCVVHIWHLTLHFLSCSLVSNL